MHILCHPVTKGDRVVYRREGGYFSYFRANECERLSTAACIASTKNGEIRRHDSAVSPHGIKARLHYAVLRYGVMERYDGTVWWHGLTVRLYYTVLRYCDGKIRRYGMAARFDGAVMTVRYDGRYGGTCGAVLRYDGTSSFRVMNDALLAVLSQRSRLEIFLQHDT